MANGFRDELIAQLPSLVLGTLAGRLGGPQAVAAFQGGQFQRQQYEDDQARQAALDEERRAQQEAAQARQAEADERASEDADRRKLLDAITYLDRYASQVGETATDPTVAENQLLGRATSLEGTFGLNQGQLSPMIQPMAPVVSQRNKRRAQDAYERAEKLYGPEAMANDGLTLTVEPFGQVKPSQLRTMFAPPAMTATGEPARPVIGKVTPPTPGSFEHYLTAPPEERAHIEAARSRFTAAGREPQSQGGRDPLLTPNEALRTTRSLRNDFIRETSSAREAVRQLELMKSSLQAVKAGAAAPGSQGVLVTFQKILDPTSVVRESEYARSASGLSLLSRLEGSWMRIKEGGAGVPVSELENFVALAEQFARNQARFAGEAKAQIDAIADRYGLDKALITREVGPQQDDGAGAGGWIDVEPGIRVRER